MMPKRKSVIQQIIVLLTVFVTLYSWSAVSGSLKGSAEKLVDERLQTESLFKTAESTPPTLTASKPNSSKIGMFSSATVWSPKEADPAWQECTDINCVLEYMEKSGASEESMQFTKKIGEEVFGVLGYLDNFEEKGRVDLGSVFLPTRANTNGALVFLNGSPSIVSSEQRGMEQLNISGDSNYSMLKKQYPQLQIWGAGAGFVSEHAKTNGGQRFILDYALVNYCHACYVGWKAQIAYDFSKDGTFEGIKFLKLVQDKNFAGENGSSMQKGGEIMPKPSLHLTASAMGKTVRENGVLELSVPVHVAVEVNLSVSQSDLSKLTLTAGSAMSSLPLSSDTLQYTWYKDNTFMSEGTSLKQKFSGSLEGSRYEIKVTSYDRRFATSASTPAVTSQAGTGLIIKVKERKEQSCRGRLGRGCDNPLGLIEDAIATDADVQQGCGGDESKICVTSKMSVGAIKHDKCCDENPDGKMCNGLKSTQLNPVKKSVCEDEWAQAVGDKTPIYFDVPTWVRWIWEPETWEYRPNDPKSIDKKNWWCHIAPTGAVVNQKNPGADKVYCKSNNLTSVDVIPSSEYTRTGFPPQFTQTKKVKLWVCAEDSQGYPLSDCNQAKGATNTSQGLGKIVNIAGTHPLDDKTIKSMITNRLKDYIPIDLIGNYMSGTNGVVEEIEILEKSYEKEQLNAIGKAFLGEPKSYWGVVVRVKGQGQVGFNSLVAGMMSGDPDNKRSFNSKTKYRFYDAGGGSWSLVSPEELRP